MLDCRRLEPDQLHDHGERECISDAIHQHPGDREWKSHRDLDDDVHETVGKFRSEDAYLSFIAGFVHAHFTFGAG
jgi:hypothetical protein